MPRANKPKVEKAPKPKVEKAPSPTELLPPLLGVELQIQNVELGRLRPHPRNYKHHPERQLQHLVESLRQYGPYRPIVAARDLTILAGHGIALAAQQLKRATFPVRVLDLDPFEPAALKLVALDNEVGRFAETDDRALSELLKEVSVGDPMKLLGTGYDDSALAKLLAGVYQPIDHPSADEARLVGLDDLGDAPDVTGDDDPGAPDVLRAPFPWFGGKSRAAHIVWRAFGDVANYVEPFAGSLAVLLARPTPPRIETVNDRDAYLANFWRALQSEPELVAKWCDAPVNEADLHARHTWLLAQTDFRERMLVDPDYHDAKIAGWWVWGLCAWIGSGWCAPRDRGNGRPPIQLPRLGTVGSGVHRKLLELGNADDSGILAWLRALSDRLRRVRVACGDWTRVLSDAVTWRHGATGVLLDPPYNDGNMTYSAGGTGVSKDVRAWAINNGDRPDMRIALCGYEGEHAMPPSWRKVVWKAHGGYAVQTVNKMRERIWLSPHCLEAAADT